MDLSFVEKLSDKSIVVIRSHGGDAEVALRLGELLYSKDAIVILRDYCLSACANYLLPAARQTFVMPHTIVGWHGGPQKIDCRDYEVQAVSCARAEQCPGAETICLLPRIKSAAGVL
jgi:hypothetical protein